MFFTEIVVVNQDSRLTKIGEPRRMVSRYVIESDLIPSLGALVRMKCFRFLKTKLLAAGLMLGCVGFLSAADKEVLLGGPELTSGIPGSGDLTVAEVRSWLAKPENHETLSVTLPMGLDKGAAGIVIPEDNPLTRAKIELGRQLYFDPRLSRDSSVSCASCHHPDKGYAFDTQFGVGIEKQTGGRNSPVSFNRILSGPQFWDGRAESLEAQAVGPIANPIEMGFTHEECVERLQGIEGYRLQFEKIFPGEGVTIDNVGKAIASFERVIVTGPSPADYYEPVLLVETQFADLVGDLEAFEEEDPDTYDFYMEALENSKKNPISESAIRGRKLFFDKKSNCSTCHTGANFTDEQYHNLGVGMDAEKPDLGRFDQTKEDKDRGAFKTPTVRNIALTGPYMHDGSQKTLEEVVEWYAKGGHPNDHLSDKVKKLELTDQDKADLVAYMKALTGAYPDVCQDRLPKN
jgi:cytochrome c peroxidase